MIKQNILKLNLFIHTKNYYIFITIFILFFLLLPIDVRAGSVHTCVRTVLGKLYSFGKAEYTGLNVPRDVLIPTLISTLQHVSIKMVSVGPGGYHTVALTTSGEVYTWGK
jgi:hypothetical protein